MFIKKLTLKYFGPFKSYEIDFVHENHVCLLLTGKNNEGKTTIINALKLLSHAAKVVNKQKQQIYIDGNQVFKLLVQDTSHINIGRVIFNYEDHIGEIRGVFDDFELIVFLNPIEEIIYSDYEGHLPRSIEKIFGFIPPLGPLAEQEEILTKTSYVKASLNTSLAPRHLRNHFSKLLTDDEFKLVKDIINNSWEGIELLDYEESYPENQINCFYKEKRITREISWAGQGLQVWFQIITHLVRLRDSLILILDEPEINLHPEKQNDLIKILWQYFSGDIIIATHSTELINNVHISHIINVQKGQRKPKIKDASDRAYLEIVRSQIGSNFNYIASQFEDVDKIIFTEVIDDYKIIKNIGEGFGYSRNTFNIPIYGFSEYKKTIAYRDAYRLLIGKNVEFILVLDRDYYPTKYLDEIKNELGKNDIKTVYTPGKEIENLFLNEDILYALLPSEFHESFNKLIEKIFKTKYDDCFGSYITLHQKFLDPKNDPKTIITKYSPEFKRQWEDISLRFNLINGKKTLSIIRAFFKEKTKTNLSDKMLIEELVKIDNSITKKFCKNIFN